MCVLIGDVHQCIGHCLIPIDPWVKILRKYKMMKIEKTSCRISFIFIGRKKVRIQIPIQNLGQLFQVLCRNYLILNLADYWFYFAPNTNIFVVQEKDKKATTSEQTLNSVIKTIFCLFLGSPIHILFRCISAPNLAY